MGTLESISKTEISTIIGHAVRVVRNILHLLNLKIGLGSCLSLAQQMTNVKSAVGKPEHGLRTGSAALLGALGNITEG